MTWRLEGKNVMIWDKAFPEFDISYKGKCATETCNFAIS